jgi:hypothetical protein
VWSGCQRFGGACCFHLQGRKVMKMEAAESSETSVMIYQFIQRHIRGSQ